MRIISGRLGGRLIRDIPASGVRPAMGKTREALFSMLEARGMDWSSARVLDLFAGGGSLAFEALSRGAKSAWLVENGNRAFRSLELNTQDLGLRDQCVLINQDVNRFLGKPAPASFNLVFIDPPYGMRLVRKSLLRLCRGAWLDAGAFVTAEIEKDAPVSASGELEYEADRLFGQTCIRIWKKK